MWFKLLLPNLISPYQHYKYKPSNEWNITDTPSIGSKGFHVGSLHTMCVFLLEHPNSEIYIVKTSGKGVKGSLVGANDTAYKYGIFATEKVKLLQQLILPPIPAVYNFVTIEEFITQIKQRNIHVV